MSLISEKKGPFLKRKSVVYRKRVFFSGIFTEKWLLSGAPSQRFCKKGSFLPFVNVSERGMFLFWRTIIQEYCIVCVNSGL